MEIRTGARRRHILTYFYIWFGLIVVSAILNAINVDWGRAHPIQGVVVVVVLTMLQASAMEFLMITIVSLIYAGIGGRRTLHIPRKYDHNLTMLINFNLLARCEEDVESAYKNMYESFMGNLSPDISAVLLSVTGKEHLRDYEIVVRDNYRALIQKTLIEEGEFLLNNQPQFVDPFRLRYFWKNFTDMSEDEVRENLEGIVNQVAMEFMCIHRVSKVLKKCGQYQDLFLLSEGETKAYTYTDLALYSTMARPFNEPLFYESADVLNIHYRQFDYSLIMDNDTVCPPGTAQELLAVAAAHPDRGIIQPSIKMDVKDTDTIYMHLEMWRQRLNEPLTRSMATLYGQWGFYGKGMINIRLYIKNMIGTRDRPLEIVPIDVLSHDTYEAAVLRPLFVDSLWLEEEPSYNYVTWHIRERRWNQGELILSRYFWPNIFGRPIGFLQRVFNKRHYIRTGIRTKVDFGLVSTHVAHSALRSMFMKPMMLVYIFLQIGVPMHRPFLPLAGVLFIVCIIPKFAITNWGNARFALLETFASILQYTPEAFIGTVRLAQAIFATICKSCTENWTPQRVVEDDMRHSNPFSSSIRHLWAYSVVAIVSTVICAVAQPDANLIYFLFATIIVIPLFTGFTSLNPDIKVIRTLDSPVDRKPTGPPESIMEQGGPPQPQQWTLVLNDPPPGPRYTPCDENSQPATFITYETEAAPMRRVQRSTVYEHHQALSIGNESYDDNCVAPRDILLDERSQRMGSVEGDAASHTGQLEEEGVQRHHIEETKSAVQKESSPDVQEAGPSGLQSTSQPQLDPEPLDAPLSTPRDQVMIREVPQLTAAEIVHDKEDTMTEDEDNVTIPVQLAAPGAVPEEDDNLPQAPVSVSKGNRLVLTMRPGLSAPKPDIPTLDEAKPEPVIPTLEEVVAKAKKKDAAAGWKAKWKRLTPRRAEKKTPSLTPQPVQADGPKDREADEPDVVGGRGKWKKVAKIWNDDEPWQPPENWREVVLKPSTKRKHPISHHSLSAVAPAPEGAALGSGQGNLGNLPQAWSIEEPSEQLSTDPSSGPVQRISKRELIARRAPLQSPRGSLDGSDVTGGRAKVKEPYTDSSSGPVQRISKRELIARRALQLSPRGSSTGSDVIGGRSKVKEPLQAWAMEEPDVDSSSGPVQRISRRELIARRAPLQSPRGSSDGSNATGGRSKGEASSVDSTSGPVQRISRRELIARRAPQLSPRASSTGSDVTGGKGTGKKPSQAWAVEEPNIDWTTGPVQLISKRELIARRAPQQSPRASSTGSDVTGGKGKGKEHPIDWSSGPVQLISKRELIARRAPLQSPRSSEESDTTGGRGERKTWTVEEPWAPPANWNQLKPALKPHYLPYWAPFSPSVSANQSKKDPNVKKD